MPIVVPRPRFVVLVAAAIPFLLTELACLSLPGTSSSPHQRAGKDGAAETRAGSLRDGAADAPGEIASHGSGVFDSGDPPGATDAFGSLDAPIACEDQATNGSCCGIFGFEDGTTSGFTPPACCANAFSWPENLSFASVGEADGCGRRALLLEATFVSADLLGCEAEPFASPCAAQIGEISAPLPGVFDVRGQELRGRIWLPADVDIQTFSPQIRAFVVSTTGIVYGKPFALPDKGWQSFSSPFSASRDLALGSAMRWGAQLVLRPSAIPNRQWSGPIWFDALGWQPAATAAP